MAKQNLQVLDETHSKNEVLPQEFASWFLEDAGKGVSFSQEDNIVPLIYVLQASSPSTKRSNPNYIEGAQAGDIWKRNSLNKPLVRGEDGIIFQPCFFEKVWIEWRPNREGLAGIHKEMPSDGFEKTILHEGREKKIWTRPNGNNLVEARQHFGYVDNEPYVISFSSSGHTVSRNWMGMMSKTYLPGTNKVAPSFAKKYKLTTVEKTNTQGSWYVFKVEDAGWVNTKDERERGVALFDAMNKGEKKAQVEDDTTDTEYHGDYSESVV